MSEISDHQLRQAWAHLSTDHIRRMPRDPSPRVREARARIIRLREEESASQAAPTQSQEKSR